MLTKYFLIAILITFTIIGCANTIGSSKKGQPLVIDPVCAYLSDMGCINIVADESTPKSTHEGITYYFCSKECKEDFDKNPSKYLKIVTPPKGAVDPVCHMKINELKRFVACVYQNKVYYFCSDHCRTKYMENPDYYIEKE
ncbi:Copper-transporting P-type ATPase [uncultured bacterium]|nr:Copper-transporting P-type ATPase [uncultured bacterium]